MPPDGSTLPPADQRYFEDYQPGTIHRFGPAIVDRTEMLEFARRFDPQRFHIEEGENGAAPIASGWFTVGLTMRLFVGHYLPTVAAMPSPGVDEIRWLAAVRAGDRLALNLTILDTRRSRSKPGVGIVRTQAELFNQRDECVMTMLLTSFFAARSATERSGAC